MLVKNLNSKTILSSDAILCTSSWSKFRGLMFRVKKLELVFKFNKVGKVGLHNFFVFFPIDLIFLDEKFKVVEMKSSFKPFTVYNPQNSCKYVLELNSGKITLSSTKVGHTLEFVDPQN